MKTSLMLNLKRTLAALLILAGITAVTAAPASAGATWCRYTGTVVVKGITIPTGNYCFSVGGSGTRIDFTSGSFNGPIIYDAAERVTFVDRYGNTYASWITYSRAGKSYGYRYWKTGINGYARAGGSVCGEMMSAGVPIGKICHRIG